MSFKVIGRIDSVQTDTLTALIYGDPGIGKTSLAFTSENPVLLDFDSGIQRACYRQTSIRVTTWEEVIEFQTSKEFKELKPHTLIIDTAGAMLDIYIANYVKNVDPKNKRRGGELSLQGYGAMKDAFNQFKNWAKAQRINLIFIAHTTTLEEGDNTKFIPKVTGGSYDLLRQECDLIGYMYSNANKRVIDFNPTDAHIGKNCAEFSLMEVPHYTSKEYPTFFQDLVEKTLDKMNALNENQVKAVKKLTEFSKGLNLIDDLENCNGLIETIGMEKDRTIQLQMFTLLKSKASDLGFEYNRTSKLFEAKK